MQLKARVLYQLNAVILDGMLRVGGKLVKANSLFNEASGHFTPEKSFARFDHSSLPGKRVIKA